MTSFVHLEYSNQHPGVARVASAIDAAQQLRHGFSASRSLATLLLSAIAAALMVVAYQVMDSVAEGHLLMLWIAVWAVAFVALVFFASAARTLATGIKNGLDSWSRKLAEARADERLWSIAKSDARVMADLQTAQSRSEYADEAVTKSSSAVTRTMQSGGAVLRAYQRNYI